MDARGAGQSEEQPNPGFFRWIRDMRAPEPLGSGNKGKPFS